jgi:hypothetical protein
MPIYQGDQYSLPVCIKHRGEIITPEDADDIAIAVGDIVKSYKDGDLTYEDGVWLFPLRKEETLKMGEEVKYQVQLQFGQDIVHTKEYSLKGKRVLECLKARLRNV